MISPNLNTVTEQLTAAGRAIEHDSFAVIDREVTSHHYSAGQWPIVRRMIHANADFDFNGLTDFHPQAVEAFQEFGNGTDPQWLEYHVVHIYLHSKYTQHLSRVKGELS